MDQGYGGWCGRLCGVGREGSVRAQFRRGAGGRGPETTPERGYRSLVLRSSLDLGPVVPGALRAIGRRGLRTLAEFGEPTLGRTSGGASGSRGRFSFSAPAGSAGPCRTPPLAGPVSLLEDATKWRRREAEL